MTFVGRKTCGVFLTVSLFLFSSTHGFAIGGYSINNAKKKVGYTCAALLASGTVGILLAEVFEGDLRGPGLSTRIGSGGDRRAIAFFVASAMKKKGLLNEAFPHRPETQWIRFTAPDEIEIMIEEATGMEEAFHRIYITENSPEIMRGLVLADDDFYQFNLTTAPEAERMLEIFSASGRIDPIRAIIR